LEEKLIPCQKAFMESYNSDDEMAYEPEYRAMCRIADVHIATSYFYDNETLHDFIVTACQAHCGYLKGE